MHRVLAVIVMAWEEVFFMLMVKIRTSASFCLHYRQNCISLLKDKKNHRPSLDLAIPARREGIITSR